MSRATCRYCGAEFEWFRTPAGKWQPLELAPADNTTVGPGRPGSVVVRGEVAYTLPPGRSVERGEVLRVPHPAVCEARRDHGARGREDTADAGHRELDRQLDEAVERDTAKAARKHGNTLRLEASRLRSCADTLDRLADAVEAL